MKRLIPTTIILCLLATAAHADDSKKRAKELWKQGNTQYELGQFDDAIAMYKAAYSTYPFESIAFNLCQAYRAKRSFEEAIWHCKSYVRHVSDDERRAVVEKLVTELEELKKAQDESQQKPPQGVDPPDNSPTAEDVASLERPPVERPWYADPPGWSMLGGGVVAGGVGIGLLFAARGLYDEANQAPETEAPALRHDARIYSIAGTVTTVVGATAVVTGVVLLLWNPSPRAHRETLKRNTTRRNLRISVGPAYLGLEGRF